MAKAPKTKSTASSSTPTAGKTATPAVASSSIDDIFAKPSKTKPTPTASSSSASTSKLIKEQHRAVASSSSGKDPSEKKKKKKAKIAASFDPSTEVSTGSGSGTASRVVEVVDPSVVQSKAMEAPAALTSTKKSTKRDRKETEEDEMFKDSRGTGPRRKTEEGFLIYKEAELQIDPEAGGTPLCPFDCECCF